MTRTNDTGPSLSRSVHLSASAGSGKTRELTLRYRSLLDRLAGLGLGIDQAIAITFTEKAAAEIKKRVMEDLPEPMLRKTVRGRQDLRISTIHSFCMSLLKRYPLEAGLPPDFSVMDERDRAEKMQRAIEDVLEQTDLASTVMTPLAAFSADELLEALAYLLRIRTRLERMEIDAGGPDELLQTVRRGTGLDRAEQDLRDLVADRSWDSTFRNMESILRQQDAYYDECRGREHLLLAGTRDPAAAAPLAAALAPVYFTREGTPFKSAYIKKKHFTGRDRTAYEAAYAAAQVVIVRFQELHGRLRAGRESFSLLALSLRTAASYRALKLREGLLDFDDLEIAAYRLLRSPGAPEILYRLDRKILHFLVDEFQDTSDIQWAILDRLTEEIFAGQGADKAMAPTLFVVGDQKQSIYRFREANYQLIDRVRERIEALPPEMRDIRTIDRNHRSVPAVIGTVNRVFTALWGSAYQPSAADRSAQHGTVRLVELLPVGGGGGATEADLLASEIRTYIDQAAPVQVRAGSAWTERTLRYEDCAVLLQSRTRLKEYEAALLGAGIPFRVIGGIGFYEEDEIQAVMNVLFFLWNRADRLALAAALRSPLFGMDDGDIYDLLLGGGDLLAGLQERRPEAAGLLAGWRNIAGPAPLADLVRAIVNDTAAVVRFGRRNRQAMFNLDKLIDTAREFDRRGYRTLQDFVEWVRRIRTSEQREATADMNLPGDRGAVNILTVHKAKGLEYPAVFLPGMNQQPRSVTTGPPVLVREQDSGISMAVKERTNPVYAELWREEKEELRREHQRLLYVAMTRAQDHLVMIGTLETGKNRYKQHGWLSSLHEALPELDPGDVDAPAVITSVFPEARPVVSPAADLLPPARRAPAGQRTAAVDPAAVLANVGPVAAPGIPAWSRTTDLLSAGREWALERTPSREEGALSPLVRGSVLHRCLEEHARSGSCNITAVVSEFPQARSLESGARDRFRSDISAVLDSLVGNEELAWIFRQQPNAYAELPFLLRREHEIISGVIDRLVIRDGKGYVIDYKAVRAENEEAVQSWIDHYRPQITVYCEAAQELFRLESVEGYLLLLDSARLARVR